jgi:hypothetical protein
MWGCISKSEENYQILCHLHRHIEFQMIIVSPYLSPLENNIPTPVTRVDISDFCKNSPPSLLMLSIFFLLCLDVEFKLNQAPQKICESYFFYV